MAGTAGSGPQSPPAPEPPRQDPGTGASAHPAVRLADADAAARPAPVFATPTGFGHPAPGSAAAHPAAARSCSSPDVPTHGWHRVAGIPSADTLFDPLASMPPRARAPAGRSVSSPTLTPFATQPPQAAQHTARRSPAATSLLHEALVRDGLTASVSVPATGILPAVEVTGPPQGSPAREAPDMPHTGPAQAPADPSAGSGECAVHDETLRKDMQANAKKASVGAMAAMIAVAMAAGAIAVPETSAHAAVRAAVAAPAVPPAATGGGAAPTAMATAAWAAAASAAAMASVEPVSSLPADSIAVARAYAEGRPMTMPAWSVASRASTRPLAAMVGADDSIAFSDGDPMGYHNGAEDSGAEDDSMNSLTEELGVHVELSPPSDDGSPSSGGTHSAAAAAALASHSAHSSGKNTAAAAAAAYAAPAQAARSTPQPLRQASPTPSRAPSWLGMGSRSSQVELCRPGVVREGGAVCILDMRVAEPGGWKAVQRPAMSAFGGADAAVEAGVAKGIFQRLFPSRPSVKRSPRVGSSLHRSASPQPLAGKRSLRVPSGMLCPSPSLCVLCPVCCACPLNLPRGLHRDAMVRT